MVKSERTNHKYKIQNIIAIIAIIFSTISLLVSVKSCEISQRNYEINLFPSLDIKITNPFGTNNFFLKIFNDGPLQVRDIKILRDFPVYYLLDLNKSGGVRAGRYEWKYDKLDVGDSIVIKIPDAYLENMKKSRNLLTMFDSTIIQKYVISTVLLKISYVKYPEVKKFYLKKYLFSIDKDVNGKLIASAYDPEVFDEENNIDILNRINDYESKKNWIHNFLDQ